MSEIKEERRRSVWTEGNKKQRAKVKQEGNSAKDRKGRKCAVVLE